ncbi:hypothetical protein PIB30_020327 [Stylosanthes scabra]|uniref:Uncharacterized protein n=1 Tax=Stylosanthes scabra TaxID=79078 RepID=A0ABU6X8M0_9FABA|nr:hypothetical protein [Stylosanthes scabra]
MVTLRYRVASLPRIFKFAELPPFMHGGGGEVRWWQRKLRLHPISLSLRCRQFRRGKEQWLYGHGDGSNSMNGSHSSLNTTRVVAAAGIVSFLHLYSVQILRYRLRAAAGVST